MKKILYIFCLIFITVCSSCKRDLIDKAKWNEENKEWYLGEYKNNVPYGKWYTWYPNKKNKSISDNPDGKYTSWYENGQKEIEATYKLGYIIGEKKVWYENGKIKRIEKWNEQKHLIYWNEWDRNGKVLKEAVERNNKISGDLWYATGNKRQQGIYKNPGARWEGYWIFWHENGKKSSEGKFINGIHVGKHIDYNKDGKKKTILYYDEQGELEKLEEIK